MKVRDLMTTDVVTVAPNTPLKDTAALLVRHRISGVPVVTEEQEVLGVLSEADILAKEGGDGRREGLLGWIFEPDYSYEKKLTANVAGDAMTTPALTIRLDAPVHKAAKKMVDEGVNRLPVVEKGKLVGIVTRADLVRAFVRSDDEIATEIQSEILRRTLWLEPGSVTVVVTDGVVELAGQVETETDAELLPVFVRRVPGVVSVQTTIGVRGRARAS